jgi:adenylyltransferase/sulfurtransferase
MTPPLEITPLEAQQKLAAGEAAFIDVREPFEHAIARIGDSQLIPMNSIPASLQHLDAQADEKLLVVFCHHGVRSLHVVDWLRRQGVENCTSMAGGIDLWTAQADQSVPRY